LPWRFSSFPNLVVLPTGVAEFGGRTRRLQVIRQLAPAWWSWRVQLRVGARACHRCAIIPGHNLGRVWPAARTGSTPRGGTHARQVYESVALIYFSTVATVDGVMLLCYGAAVFRAAAKQRTALLLHRCQSVIAFILIRALNVYGDAPVARRPG
jgi:hypothetical protein